MSRKGLAETPTGGREHGVRRNSYYSTLLGVYLEVTRKTHSKPTIEYLGKSFSLFLQDKGYSKLERRRMADETLTVVGSDGRVTGVATMSVLKEIISSERRNMKFSSENADRLNAQKKMNNLLINELESKLGVVREGISEINKREKQRKRRKQLAEYAAKVGMTVEELEAQNEMFRTGKRQPRDSSAEDEVHQNIEVEGKGPESSVNDEEDAKRDEEKLAVLNEEREDLEHKLAIANDVGKTIISKLEDYDFREATLAHFLDFVQSLPPLDKDGKEFSITSLKDIYKFRRSQSDHLTTCRIKTRMTMSRIEESNDAFLGQEELFRLISFIRSPIWVKCYMKWYKFKEQSKKIRGIAGKVGLNTSKTLVAKAFEALLAALHWKREMTRISKKIESGLSSRFKIWKTFFPLWLQVVNMKRTVASSHLKSHVRMNARLKEETFKLWRRAIRSRKKAAMKWFKSTLSWAFVSWSSLLEDHRLLYGEVTNKLQGVVVGIGATMGMIMLKEWNLVVSRRKAALKRWSQGALWRCLKLWIQSYEEAMSVFEEVREKFSSIVSYISGETMSLMFEEWKSLWSKNKRAAMRFKNTSLWFHLSSWISSFLDRKREAQVLASIRHRMHTRELRAAFLHYAQHVEDLGIDRAIIRHVVACWTNLSLFKSVRKLLTYHQRAKFHKLVAWKIKERHCLLLKHRLVVTLMGFAYYCRKVRAVLSRARTKAFMLCYDKWQDVTMSSHYSHQLSLAKSSPTISRFLRRGLHIAIIDWRDFVRWAERGRGIVARFHRAGRMRLLGNSMCEWFWILDEGRRRRKEEMRSAVEKTLIEGDIIAMSHLIKERKITFPQRQSLDQDELRTMIIETVQSKALFPNIFSRSRQQPRTSSPQFGNGASSLVDMEESKSRRGGKLFIASSQNESMHPRSTGKVRYVREKSLSHAEASQWIVGGPPQRPLLPKLGIGRLHADSFYSSHLPVPLTDYNYTSPEVRLKSHSKIVDFQSSVSLRSPETVKPPRASSLAFADLVAQGDYSKERTSRKSFKETAVRISHFKSIMSASR